MLLNEMLGFLDFSRQKTLGLLDTIAKEANPQAILGWRPAPGRAHIGWQLMHIGATDDRHVHVRMLGGQPLEAEYVRRFAGGSTPDDSTPSVEEIRRYLGTQRQALLAHLKKLDDAALDKKPNDQAPWTYREWIKVLAWHEAHHQGQAHMAMNLFKATQAKA